MADVNGNLENEVSVPSTASYREIITKAICGTGKQDFRYTETLTVAAGRIPSSILGSSVTRVRLTEPLVTEISNDDKKNVRISGTLDINVWYSYNDDQVTDVAKETVKFTELVPIDEISECVTGQIDARAILVKAPQATKTVITDNNQIQVDVELGLYAEITGETKILVHVYDNLE